MPTSPVGLVGAVGLACALAVPGALAADPQALLDQYRCSICHAERDPLAGPAWAAIAARYRNQKDAESILVARIRAGARGGGLWHMPPHPEVSRHDAETLATWILAVRP